MRRRSSWGGGICCWRWGPPRAPAPYGHWICSSRPPSWPSTASLPLASSPCCLIGGAPTWWSWHASPPRTPQLPPAFRIAANLLYRWDMYNFLRLPCNRRTALQEEPKRKTLCSTVRGNRATRFAMVAFELYERLPLFSPYASMSRSGMCWRANWKPGYFSGGSVRACGSKVKLQAGILTLLVRCFVVSNAVRLLVECGPQPSSLPHHPERCHAVRPSLRRS